MACSLFLMNLFTSEQIFLIFIQIYNTVISILNISGNSILIWGLHRTRQTKTISFQFIVIMSASDLTTGVVGLISMVLVLFEQYQKYCLLRIGVLAVFTVLNVFSSLMVCLVAFDRFLHMRYLETYQFKFTKVRGYFLVIILAVLALATGVLFALPLTLVIHSILQMACSSMAAVILILTLFFYRKALSTMRRNGNQITRSIINLNRALGKAAKRVSICYFILSVPLIATYFLNSIKLRVAIFDSSILEYGFWFAYVTYLANGFCSSVTFISQNIPIRRVLRRVVMDKWNRIRSVVGAVETNS